jgi:hypothetical protein
MPPAVSANAQELDNASFLVSLSPELRAEVLLTAEPTFLATLPPELVAEAQMHRERAAAQWQQREMQRRYTSTGPTARGRAPSRGLAPNEAAEREQHEEDDEGSEEEEDDMDESEYRTAARARDNREEEFLAAQAASRSPAEGLMLLPGDDTDRTLAPSHLLPTLALLISDETLPIKSPFLYRLLQNIAKNPRLRDSMLRLLISMLVEDEGSADKVVRELKGLDSDDGNEKEGKEGKKDKEGKDGGKDGGKEGGKDGGKEGGKVGGNDEEVLSGMDTLRPSGPYAVRKGLKGRKGLSQMSASRLIAVLFHLASANISTAYDMLRPRESKGGTVRVTLDGKGSGEGDDDKDEDNDKDDNKGEKNEKGEKVGKNEEKITNDNINEGKERKGEKKEYFKEEIAKLNSLSIANHSFQLNGVPLLLPNPEGVSTMSLFEMLMPLFSRR